MHMNPEGLMCLHYLGCDLSPTSSTSIMHHIHKQATDLGAPATHSYYFNWIKSVQISRAQLPHCGFIILVVIWFVCCIALPSWRHCRSTSYMPQELLSSMGFRWLPYGTYSTFKTNMLFSRRSGKTRARHGSPQIMNQNIQVCISERNRGVLSVWIHHLWYSLTSSLLCPSCSIRSVLCVKHSVGEVWHRCIDADKGVCSRDPERAHIHTQASLYPINIRLVTEPIDSFLK